MPELQTVSTTPYGMQKGDLWFGRPITSVDCKQKFAYVKTEGNATPARIGLDSKYEVQRMLPTEDEKAADHVRFVQEARAKYVATFLASAENALEAAEAARVKYTYSPANYGANSFTLDSMLEAEATARFLAVIPRGFEHYTGEGLSEWEAVELIVQSMIKTATERVLQYSARITSQSTSTISNVLSAMDAQAAAQFVRGLRWDLLRCEPSFQVPDLY